jgi:hypothetical protein
MILRNNSLSHLEVECPAKFVAQQLSELVGCTFDPQFGALATGRLSESRKPILQSSKLIGWLPSTPRSSRGSLISELEDLFDDVTRPALCFHVCLAEVFPDDPHRDQLYSSQKEYWNNGGRPTWHAFLGK